MKKQNKVCLLFLVVLVIGFLPPENLQMPVENATNKDYNAKSFWYYPWGKSITHKGVDIFAKDGTKVKSSVKGIVVYSGELSRGGKVVLVLGTKWRLHYFAHLKKIYAKRFDFVSQKSLIGKVGRSGNAKGKAPHLHYSIVTLIPYPWRLDSENRQGWKKIFYLNPIDYLIEK